MLFSNLKILAIPLTALLVGRVAAKTDLAGCVSSKTVAFGGASLIWYVPDTGEICEFLDCGGGRAPPKTTVPGCGFYSGTATYSPSFLPGFGVAASASSTENYIPASTPASVAASTTTAAAESIVTEVSSSTGSITAGPTATTLETSTASNSGSSSATSSQGTESSSPSGSTGSPGSASVSGSTSVSGSSSSSSSISISQGAAAVPTAAVKGVIGMAAGLVAGVAML
ncbi:hypothetical protein AAE478_007238 [Parahypoxylon ruwenzoriense]